MLQIRTENENLGIVRPEDHISVTSFCSKRFDVLYFPIEYLFNGKFEEIKAEALEAIVLGGNYGNIVFYSDVSKILRKYINKYKNFTAKGNIRTIVVRDGELVQLN